MVTKDPDRKPTTVPAWARGHVKPDDLAGIAAAIANAEVHTCAEIVPVLVRRSIVTGHVPVMLILVYLLLLVAVWSAFSGIPAWMVILAAVIGGLAVLQAARLPLLCRMMTDDDDIDAQVTRRAELEFFRAGLNKTAGSTGILLFVSLEEREAVVLADQGISSLLPASTWDDVCRLMLEGARSGHLGDGIAKAVKRCGELAGAHFPPGASNPNEVRNTLLIRE